MLPAYKDHIALWDNELKAWVPERISVEDANELKQAIFCTNAQNLFLTQNEKK